MLQQKEGEKITDVDNLKIELRLKNIKVKHANAVLKCLNKIRKEDP